MMRIYGTVLTVVAALRPVMAEIEAHDRDLAPGNYERGVGEGGA